MKNRTTSRRWRALSLLAVVGVLALASCSDNKSDGGSDGSTKTSTGSGESADAIRISSQDFSEQKVLAQVYGQYLEDQGIAVDIQDPIGTRDQLYDALENDKIDLQLDYSGSAVVFLEGEDVAESGASADAQATFDALQPLLKEIDLESSEQSEAADANALVALKSWAEENGVTTISDLAGVDGTLTLGGAAECAERQECLLGYQDTYGLDLKFKAVEYGPPLVAALEADEIQVAQYGSTAPEIATGKIVELEDDKGLQDAQNVVPVFRTSVSSPELIEALNTISAAITTEDLAAWNQATDVDKEDPVDVATKWLQDNDLLK
ncbi:MAG TPA: ABC transporter substrate-binding protein [Acidimicrobiales bacterium]|jgi:osmoprotectant transport system substrate-binding protein|nr:ABC transporter substrate-binding protein [Acidimicrobiales bacterium]